MHTHTRALSALFPWFFDPAAAVRENTQQWVKILFEDAFWILYTFFNNYVTILLFSHYLGYSPRLFTENKL